MTNTTLILRNFTKEMEKTVETGARTNQAAATMTAKSNSANLVSNKITFNENKKQASMKNNHFNKPIEKQAQLKIDNLSVASHRGPKGYR